mgnify:CR=1 FL=1
MLKMSEQSALFLQKNFPELLAIDDLPTFLDKLDDFILMNGLDSNDNMTAFGHEADAVFNEVYCCN